MFIKNTKYMKAFLTKYYRKLIVLCYQTLSIISPTLNTKVRYKAVFKKKMDLNNPKTFKEKLLTLKLKRYIKDPLVVKCADKYAVREYIKEQGCENILIPLLASYDNAKDIEWERLPESFVIKWNFGCGFNIICPNKSKLDITATTKKLNYWKKDKSYLNYSEMQYRKAPKKIIVEQYLKPANGELPADYKVYCFNGEPKAILYMCDRGSNDMTAAFFDENWKFLSETGKSGYKKFEKDIKEPACLKEMIEVSKKLSKPFEFVRMDYYIINDKLYFGEMTFTPAGCMFASECTIDGKTMGELLDTSKYERK